jgi:hypothetical protein
MSDQGRAPVSRITGTRRSINKGTAAIVPLRPPLRRGITGLYFYMPETWRRERREAMLRTMPRTLVELITGETVSK